VHQIELEMQNDELKLEQNRLRLAASVFDNTYEGIIITDAKKIMLEVNPAFSRITGYEAEEAIGQTPKMLAFEYENQRYYPEMRQALQLQGCWRGELINRHKNGARYIVTLSITKISDEHGQLTNYVGVFTDISQLKRHEAELESIAHFDPLTGVPNRLLLLDRLEQAILHAQRSGLTMAVCFLDLDDFKLVNDQHGHAAGDQLLIEITRRLHHILRPDDTLARLGGDEFVLLLNGLHNIEECHSVLKRILNTISQPVMINELPIQISASIGATVYPLDDTDTDPLIRHADQAMYAAKQAGKNRFHLYNPEEDLQFQRINQNRQRLRNALANHELVMFYQPKVDLLSGAVIGAEALLRWQHPEHGLLTPSLFLQDITDSDLEIPIGEWVIESVLQQMSQWQSIGLHMKVSLNISAAHLLQDNFSDQLGLALAAHPDIQANDLELEILETAAISDLIRAIHTMERCHQLGVRFALDDFGTGYSSLAYFRRLPIDMLKIDQCFVRDMLSDATDLSIVEGVVLIASAFKRPVIAEGVETLQHGALLVKIGCHLCQGYGIAHPMPAADLYSWMDEWYKNKVWLTLDKTPGINTEH
jgi:diguanylate cyclase (GGDEF)-like protein/PAS domain S-box-containing protein